MPVARTPISPEQRFLEVFKLFETDPPADSGYQRGYLATLVESAAQVTQIDKYYLITLLRKNELEEATSIWR